MYDKVKEFFEKGEIIKMFDYGGNILYWSVSVFIYIVLNKGEELFFFKV